MTKKVFAVITAVAALCSVTGVYAPVSAADSFQVNVSVDMDGPRKAISPYIYGINDSGHLDQVTVTAVRQGGNRYTAYNWENNYSNAGSDWKHNSDTYLTNGYSTELAETPGACAIHLSQDCASRNIGFKSATIQMAGYVSADADGPILETETPPSARWKQVKATKGSAFSMTPDLTDDYVYMDEYVNYLVNTLGDSTTATGINAYNLDNEPSLWSYTHALMHPEKTTCEEMVTKSAQYASAIKAVDPHAEVFGLALFGFGAYTGLNEAPDWTANSSKYNWFISYYLDKMKEEEAKAGKRLIDAVDVHYYSEAKGTCRVTNCTDEAGHKDCMEARMQAPRTLFEKGYIENSWIGEWGQQYLPILPTIQDSIDKYYPGTKIAMTEYNFGGGNHISGAVAQADVLGVFASNDVYVATLWPLETNIPYQLSAINLYTNYDGKGSSFGDTLVSAKSSDTENATAYAAIDGSDESKVTLVLTNKNLTSTEKATISLNSDADYSSAAVYGLTGGSSEIKLMKAINDIADNTFTVEIPAMSVVQIEISGEAFTLKGDADADGDVDDADVAALTAWVLHKKGASISNDNSDMNDDGVINAFDLGLLKQKIDKRIVPTETERTFENINTATWKVEDGCGGKTMTCTFTGETGADSFYGYGYWDNDTEEWIQGDDTSLGGGKFNANGEYTVSFEVPEKATSLQVQCYYYAKYDASIGDNVEMDLELVGLKSVTTH